MIVGSPSRSALRPKPAATTASADFSLSRLWRDRPFSHKARPPQVRTRSFPAQPPNLHRLSLDHESFAVTRPLALLGAASYPVLVHRLAVSLHASFPHSVTLMQLRFASFAVVCLWEDFHLQDRAHAGRTGLGEPFLAKKGSPKPISPIAGGHGRPRLLKTIPITARPG